MNLHQLLIYAVVALIAGVAYYGLGMMASSSLAPYETKSQARRWTRYYAFAGAIVTFLTLTTLHFWPL